MEGIENVLDQLIGLMVGGVDRLATGVGTGINGFVQDVFLQVSESGAIEGLSVAGGMVGVFAGVSLAVGLTTFVFTWLRSLGN